MNKTVNFPKAGIISIINGPGGQDELIIYIVTERLFNMCKLAKSKIKPFNPYIISNSIQDLLWENEILVSDVLHYDTLFSYGEYPVEYLNKYEFVGMIPIEDY